MTRPLALTLALVLAAPCHAAPAPAPAAETWRTVAAQGRPDAVAVDRLYARAVLDGRVEALFRELDEAGERRDLPVPKRAAALRMRAAMEWRHGLIEAASADADRALALAPGVDAWLLRARLLDARGRPGEAVPLYRQAMATTTEGAERAAIALRLATIAALGAPATLAAYARDRPVAERDRLAVVAGLLGNPRDALNLYRVEGTDAYRQHVRLAEWAIAAADPVAARDHAWQAHAVATTVADRRYALALLLEGFRARGALGEAVTFLDAKPGDAEVTQAKVDALLELGRYDAAIAAVSGASDPALRRRLLGILDIAGRKPAAMAEYRRLIAAEPDRVEWYEGLATLYVGDGDEAGALAVYRQLFAANRGRIEVLGRAARQMAAMGLAEPALALMEQAGRDPAFALPVQLFRFETYQAQGRDAEALAVLEALRRRTPAGSPLRADLAEGYERLGRKDLALAMLRDLAAGRPSDYDRRLHIAQLAYDTGDVADALARWRALWAESTLPARRSFLEMQIVRAAKRLGRLDTLAAELERGSGGLDLLIGVRLAQNDRAGAVAAVERQAARGGLGEAAKLEQLAGVYARLRDYPRLNAVLRRLVTADPRNADLYLRRLTLNTIRFDENGGSKEARVAGVAPLLAELQARSGFDRTRATQFGAGIYAMASLGDQAIDQYRRALALAPGDADTLLQLADQLAKQGRVAEAAAMLQFAAERASDTAGFAVAIGGLVDTLSGGAGQDDGNAVSLRAPERLRWAERLVLERIARTGDDPRLYTLLADLAQEQADFDLQRRAYDAMLAIADDQRPAVLRQLIALTSGSAGSDSAGPTLADAARKVAYGRRLIASRRAYPPDVYADLARTLLKQGDVPGAERAFGMMTDGGGLVNVEQVKGAAYYAEPGLAEAALRNYGRALARDQENLDVIVHASILREQLGQPALANRWYWRGLRTLILRQPLRGDATGDTAGDGGLDVKQYYATLVEGLLLTLSPADRAPVLAQLDALLADTLAQVDAANAQSLAAYPRLALLVRLARRIDGIDRGRVAALDAALALRFAGDAEVRREGDHARHLAGIGEAPVEGDWVTDGLATQAADSDNFDLALDLALVRRDRAAITALVAQALAIEKGWRLAHAQSDAAGLPPNQLYQTVLRALDVLPRDAVAELVLAPLQPMPFRDAVLFDVYRSAPAAYAKLEAILGAPPLSAGARIDLLVAHGNDPLPTLRTSRRDLEAFGAAMQAALAAFTPDQALTLYDRLVRRMEENQEESGFQSTLIAHLLTLRLDTVRQERLLAVMRRDLVFDRDPRNPSAAPVVERLLLFDPAIDRPLLLRAARMVAERFADGRRLPAVLEAVFADDEPSAYQSLKALQADTAVRRPDLDYAGPIVRARFTGELRREVDAFFAKERPDPAEVASFYRRFVEIGSDDSLGHTADDLFRYYRRLVALEPDNQTYLMGLIDLRLGRSDYASAIDLLRPYVDRHRDDKDAATVLQLAYALAGRPDAVRDLARSSGVDIADAAWLGDMVNRSGTARAGNAGVGFRPLFNHLYPIYAAAHPDDAAVVGIERRRSAAQQLAMASADDTLTPLTDTLAQRPADAVAVLRRLWRDSASFGSADEAAGAARLRLVLAMPDPDAVPAADAAADTGIRHADAALLAAMTTNPALADELDRYLAAIEPEVRGRRQPLYALLAQALIAQNRATGRLAALWAALAGGTLGGHDVQLLATLVDRMTVVPTPAQRAQLSARLAAMPVQSAQQRLLFASVYARAGDYPTAGRMLEAAAVQTMFFMPADVEDRQDVTAPLAGIVAALGRWPDAEAARRIYASIAARLKLTHDASAAGDLPPLPARL